MCSPVIGVLPEAWQRASRDPRPTTPRPQVQQPIIPMLKAFFWDVDGTLAETERDGHRIAFNRAFESCGLPWRWDVDRYGWLLQITGGRERLLVDMEHRADAPPASERNAIAQLVHARKNAVYAELVGSGAIPLRAGVLELMRQGRERGIRMGITTTTSRCNVDALLRTHLGERWAQGFAVTICGEDVLHKKPAADVYLQALRTLDIQPCEALAIEDAPAGAAAARAAGIPVLITRSVYFADAPIEDAVAIGPGLHQRRDWQPALQAFEGADRPVDLDDIECWRSQYLAASGQRPVALGA